MKQYIGTKMVQAEFSYSEPGPEPLRMRLPGYKVVDEDGSESWLPKKSFEKTYRLMDGMTFGMAIEAAKQGKRIRRCGWNGKNQYIELASAISYKNPDGVVVNADHDAIGNKAFAFCGTSGVQMGWLASQADMLADDWEIAGGGNG